MGYFDNCRPDQRFSTKGIGPDSIYADQGSLWIIYDWDQRRTISVGTKWEEDDEDFIFEALAEHIDDDLPRDATLIEVGQAGEMLFYTCDWSKDRAPVPFYPSLTDFPPSTPRLRRSDLTEKKRLGVQVDLVTYKAGSSHGQDVAQLAFKYYMYPNSIALVWNELNCWMRIPSHPNIVPFHGLVYDTVSTFEEEKSTKTTSKDKVVGFTTHFVPGGTVLDNISRTFRLSHLRQLVAVIDYLNLELGIAHGDITTYNLLIEPETDALKLFDFNLASHIGDLEGDTATRARNIFLYEEEKKDVKYAIFTLYEIITRNMHFREENYPHELDVGAMLPEVWEKHPEVQLDAPVGDYRRVLNDWVKRRDEVKGQVSHWRQASRPIEWPSLPKFDPMYWGGEVDRRESAIRQEYWFYGYDYLKWQRPASAELTVVLPEDEERRLLATGIVVDESGNTVDLGAQILSVRVDSEDDGSLGGDGSVDGEMTEKL